MVSAMNGASTYNAPSPLPTRRPPWMCPIRLSAPVCRAASQCAGLAEPACRGWRWVVSALAVGTQPFLVSYTLGVPGHQVASAFLLMLLCLPCARVNAWARGIGSIALAYAAHCLVVIALAHADPQGVSPLLPDADAYWQKQILWITTGYDPEYQLSAWVPAHLRLLVGTVVYTYTSFGVLIFYEGFYEVDLMNFYTAQLLHRSQSQPLALAVGWHLWSLLRGMGYLFITFEVLSLSLRHLIGSSHLELHGRRWRWAVGISLILADGLVKATLLAPVREHLFANLR